MSGFLTKRLTGLLALVLCTVPVFISAQNFLQGGQVNGNFQMDAQYYKVDSAIRALPIPEKMQMNSWTNITYTAGNLMQVYGTKPT